MSQMLSQIKVSSAEALDSVCVRGDGGRPDFVAQCINAFKDDHPRLGDLLISEPYSLALFEGIYRNLHQRLHLVVISIP